MSLRLGEIHYWLYRQIKIIEEREVKLITAFKERYGEQEVGKLAKELRAEYGELKSEEPLEDLIGDEHIHPWLEGAITTAQIREAVCVKRLLEEFSNETLLRKVYYNQGRELARKVWQKNEENNLELTFRALKNNFLERMPCDQLSTILVKEEDKIVWRHDSRLHTEFWSQTDVSIKLMHQLYQIWIEGFIEAINPSINYQRQIEKEYYDDIFVLEEEE
ncbi:hypothetical protein MWH28_07735 [Natroniella sulfidigena]|uniref:hypothetical protein n=1 Tax=Natroniella sulfidigena TaxID=723921 RepID=UPI00200B5D31|nr:hypothetical protein [Natroniella sulfidigena]MCK8817250.1 hypothetical protein [Natroniella sulfidigena]